MVFCIKQKYFKSAVAQTWINLKTSKQKEKVKKSCTKWELGFALLTQMKVSDASEETFRRVAYIMYRFYLVALPLHIFPGEWGQENAE